MFQPQLAFFKYLSNQSMSWVSSRPLSRPEPAMTGAFINHQLRLDPGLLELLDDQLQIFAYGVNKPISGSPWIMSVGGYVRADIERPCEICRAISSSTLA